MYKLLYATIIQSPLTTYSFNLMFNLIFEKKRKNDKKRPQNATGLNESSLSCRLKNLKIKPTLIDSL